MVGCGLPSGVVSTASAGWRTVVRQTDGMPSVLMREIVERVDANAIDDELDKAGDDEELGMKPLELVL